MVPASRRRVFSCAQSARTDKTLRRCPLVQAFTLSSTSTRTCSRAAFVATARSLRLRLGHTVCLARPACATVRHSSQVCPTGPSTTRCATRASRRPLAISPLHSWVWSRRHSLRSGPRKSTPVVAGTRGETAGPSRHHRPPASLQTAGTGVAAWRGRAMTIAAPARLAA